MKKSWIKLYIEILGDPKMGRLPDNLWRRAVELFLLAGEHGDEGSLPPLDDMSWRLRCTVEQLVDELRKLSQVGIVNETADGWIVTNFKTRQYSESYERVKRYRNAQSNAGSNDGVAENESSSSSTSPLLSSSDSEEGGGVGEETIWVPETVVQAKAHPDIMTYQKISGQFPGEHDWENVVQTIHYLRGIHGEKLNDYLIKFWTAWAGRKTKDQKPYNPKSKVWLYEWAMQGTIPSANGHEPKVGETDNQAIIRKVAQNAKR